MLFRTRVFLAFSSLGTLAIGGAALLILSAHLNERAQSRTALAYETLSGYFELSGAIFRTFKQVRRHLVSGDGTLALDFPVARDALLGTLDRIETASRAETEFLDDKSGKAVLEDVRQLRRELLAALDAIDTAANLISAGSGEDGRALAITVLEGQVDVRIARLMDEAILLERRQLEAARSDLRVFHARIRMAAWALATIALALTAAVLLPLIGRFSRALRSLRAATHEYAADNLDHKIELGGRDELSDVARRLEEMAGQIQTKRTDLERIRAELEERVESRTAELSDVNLELEERERRRRQFFADIGHELRTPVTAIRGEAEVALRARTDRQAAQRDALGRIVLLTAQLTDSVNDLFLIAREQAGMLDMRNAVLDLNEPVQRAVEEMRGFAADAGGKIGMHLSGDGVEVEGNAARLSQLVRILVSNALAHAPRGVKIDVSTDLDDGQAVLTIADDGPGVAPADRKHIFDRYTRGQSAMARSASGTGLGLAIAKSIAQAHGGTIRVEESLAGGAAFRIALPWLATVP